MAAERREGEDGRRGIIALTMNEPITPASRSDQRYRYRGRFAPSPTGPLHAGSLVAALASWLDARVHDGVWLVRIEDVDPPREEPGAARDILATLDAFGLVSDEPVLWQHERHAAYTETLAQLERAGDLYACQCSRLQIADTVARLGLPATSYPGTCRTRGLAPQPGRALRVRVDSGAVTFVDRACGWFTQDVAHEVGDFVVRRADGLVAYQLAVVVDDIAQGITDVVRGADLLDNTPRQIVLQRRLGVSPPRYLHVPLVRAADGEKLSKQNGATPLDRTRVIDELVRAAGFLGMPTFRPASRDVFLQRAIDWWREHQVRAPTIDVKE
jgi:glutamyl-Q tRNA(Asp) synthetase